MTEEYSDDGEGGVRMLKRKVVQKNVPPDVSALKLLVDLNASSNIKELTDDELEKEKIRLIKILTESKENKNDN